jgi:hypothetical protein
MAGCTTPGLLAGAAMDEMASAGAVIECGAIDGFCGTPAGGLGAGVTGNLGNISPSKMSHL